MEDISQIREKAISEIKGSSSLEELEGLRVKYLGRKGVITDILRSLKDMSIEDKKKVGPMANSLKDDLTEMIDEKKIVFEKEANKPNIDITRPGKEPNKGHRHPLSIMEKEVIDIFSSMNFSVVDGPESETEHYNFDALNIPGGHPARDEWDTFWLKSKDKDRKLMRTHTSPVQVRFMEKNEPPFRIIVPGRVFRYEATDASHEINFYQVEGLVVGDDITLANLKYTIETFLSELFGDDNIEFRYRPSFFPFTEPSLEVDIKLNDQWLEVMGAGMVNRKVFEAVGYDPNKLQGFAFGVGLDRLAMIKYDIPDVRLFYSGDLRFIKQF